MFNDSPEKWQISLIGITLIKYINPETQESDTHSTKSTGSEKKPTANKKC